MNTVNNVNPMTPIVPIFDGARVFVTHDGVPWRWCVTVFDRHRMWLHMPLSNNGWEQDFNGDGRGKLVFFSVEPAESEGTQRDGS